jgi:hypothetical protein
MTAIVRRSPASLLAVLAVGGILVLAAVFALTGILLTIGIFVLPAVLLVAIFWGAWYRRRARRRAPGSGIEGNPVETSS